MISSLYKYKYLKENIAENLVKMEFNKSINNYSELGERFMCFDNYSWRDDIV